MPRSLQCRLFIDLAPGDGTPKRGDYLVTHGRRGPGSGYLVLGARQVRRRKPAAAVRFNLVVQHVPLEDAMLGVRWWMRWYSRNKNSGR